MTEMQTFFLNTINRSDRPISPNYLAVLWYEHKDIRRPCSSRSSFGQTSAAYKTCRKLVELKMIRLHSENGITNYSRLNQN